ncbi:MAG: hypothetical protein LBV23_07435 [Deltaproteobacteria bacterium]|jgi:Flp pilus assembly protein TadD|nr:hypothetical protein [Deltaproteobacteria bacterium]
MSVEKLLKDGEDLFKAGRKVEAEAAFKEVLALEPGQARALNNLAVMTIIDHRFEEAERYITKALAKDPAEPSALNNRFKLALLQNRWDIVYDVAEILLAQNPDDLKILKIAVKAAVKQKNFEKVLPRAERLIELAPDDVDALTLFAQVSQKIGDRNGAEKALRKAITLAPERGEVATHLALLNKPEAKGEHDLWPRTLGQSPLTLAQIYRQTWAGIKTTDPVITTAQILGSLHDPGTLTDEELAKNPAPAIDKSYLEKIPSKAADIAGLSIMFAPTVIAGQSAMMSRYLQAHQARTTVVEIAKNYLGYEADIYYPQNQAEMPGFLEQLMEKAEKVDVLCLEFGSSFHYMPNFIGRTDFRVNHVPDQPYADLRRLKDKGVKIFFRFFGSDFLSQSVAPYLYLRYLGFERLPRPPFQTRFQHHNVKAADELADAFLAVDFDFDIMPRVAPFFDTYFESKMWPLKTNYRPRLEKILTAPTNHRKKNYTLIQSALSSFQVRHPQTEAFNVQNTPHAQVPQLYSKADVGIDQATFGFGTFSVEMMALGLPVIVSRPPAHCQRDAAPVLSFNNIRELEARLEECFQNPGSLPKLGRQGREYVTEYHDIEVGGRVFSHYLAQAAAGETVPQILRPGYEKFTEMWKLDPESIYGLRFYDVAVPLFCALGEMEYAIFLCRDALDCGHRPEKFTAWFRAVSQASKIQGVPIFSSVPETAELAKETARRLEMLNRSRDLLEDSNKELAEAERIKNAADGV